MARLNGLTDQKGYVYGTNDKVEYNKGGGYSYNGSGCYSLTQIRNKAADNVKR